MADLKMDKRNIHDHAQMIFRGIIGSKCNKTLGLVDDSIPRLKALMDYLGRFQ